MTTSEIPVQTGYLPVNGLQMYYEIHGTGQPLVLLHGAFSAIGTSFGQLLPGLAQGRQVVAVELQGHGRTADIDRPMTLEGHGGRRRRRCRPAGYPSPPTSSATAQVPPWPCSSSSGILTRCASWCSRRSPTPSTVSTPA